jgi:hypothetical protein
VYVLRWGRGGIFRICVAETSVLRSQFYSFPVMTHAACSVGICCLDLYGVNGVVRDSTGTPWFTVSNNCFRMYVSVVRVLNNKKTRICHCS